MKRIFTISFSFIVLYTVGINVKSLPLGATGIKPAPAGSLSDTVLPGSYGLHFFTHSDIHSSIDPLTRVPSTSHIGINVALGIKRWMGHHRYLGGTLRLVRRLSLAGGHVCGQRELCRGEAVQLSLLFKEFAKWPGVGQ